MKILGLNAYHPNSSACLVVDGKLIAAVEEERFERTKHWSGFPEQAIRYCLKEGKIDLRDLDYITVNRNPKVNLLKKARFVMLKGPDTSMVFNRLKNLSKIGGLKDELAKRFNVSKDEIGAKVVNVEHHLAHLASSFFVSPFEEACVVSTDAFGDFTSLKVAKGRGNKIEELYEINYPHSLGIFYTAITQYLGFPKFGSEYKVMGLAAYGQPKYLDQLRKIVILEKDGRFRLNLDYFKFHKDGDGMSWDGSQPKLRKVYTLELLELLGKERHKGEGLTQRHKDIAASLQVMYEEAIFHILNHAHKLAGSNNLCLAGGCALNSAANGKIFDRTPFTEVYIQPASSDAGGALGSALYLHNHILDNPRSFQMDHALWGPGFTDEEIKVAIQESDARSMNVERVDRTEVLVDKVARLVSDGGVVGWFQGRLEWGPRALGDRTILADPRRREMRDRINEKIKMREEFRPFAPSILEEAMGEYFNRDYPDPFMIRVHVINDDKRDVIPAVTHADGTGRPQSVTRETNPLYYDLIKRFGEITGVPVILNTSFNENEPIVCTPQEAIDCFLRTKMDAVALGNYIIRR